MNGQINLFTHYNPDPDFKAWMEVELSAANDDPILFIHNMAEFYLTMKETEHKTPFIEMMIELMKEWFDKQLIRPMSLDYSVQVRLKELDDDSISLITLPQRANESN